MNSFKAFYPIYKSAHSSFLNRLMHFIGTSLMLLGSGYAMLTQRLWPSSLGILLAYFFAGIGHSHFEKKSSMRFTHPILCILGAGLLYLETWKQIFTRSKPR